MDVRRAGARLAMGGARRRLLGLAGVAVAAGTTALGASPVLATRAPSVGSPTTIMVEKTKSWGPVLALSSGWTIYRLTLEPMDKSTCSGRCAQYWPPVVLAPGQSSPLGHGVGHLGTISRPGGARQVTYEGIPLYRFVGDSKPGQVNGNVKDAFGQGWVVNPANPRSVPRRDAGGAPVTTTTFPSGGVAY